MTFDKKKYSHLIGHKHNRLTVMDVCRRQISGQTRTFLECRCDCGNTCFIQSYIINTDLIKSCGCYNSEQSSKRSFKDGRAGTSEFYIYNAMRQRCLNTKNRNYKYYGGRGIKISSDWLVDFSNFLVDMGKRPSKNHSIERIDNNGDYCKENCKWATIKEQGNNKRTTRFIEFNGERLTISQWSERTSLSCDLLSSRILRNWPTELLLTTPSNKIRRLPNSLRNV